MTDATEMELRIDEDPLVMLTEEFVRHGAEERGAILTPECLRWLAQQLVKQRRKRERTEHDVRVAVESFTQTRFELGDAAFEDEGSEEVGLLGVVEVAEEIGEDPPSPRLRRGAGDER